MRAGIALGRNIYLMRALQVKLALGVVLHESSKDDKMEGYCVSFHDSRFDDKDRLNKLDVQGEGNRPHPYTGLTCGTSLGADGPHGTNHNNQCQRDHSGVGKCLELGGLHLNPHELDDSRELHELHVCAKGDQ